MGKYFIGLSTSGHDPAFAIVNEKGKVIFAEASERFLQCKRAWGIAPDHIDHVAPHIKKIIKDDPYSNFFISTSWKKEKQSISADNSTKQLKPSSLLVDSNIGEWMLGIQSQIHKNSGHNIKTIFESNINDKIMNFDHHLCHATNAVYSSPYDNALVLVSDGEGEVGALSLFHLKNRKLKRLWRSWGPGSLGTYYCWLTSLCGFDWIAGEEWKVMGLAAFGEPDLSLLEVLETIIIFEDGRPIFADKATILNVEKKLSKYVRKANEPVEKASVLAATGQLAYEKFMNKILNNLKKYGEDNLILSGGTALNSSYNGKIVKNTFFNNVHIPSAPADDGNAIGSALLGWMEITENKEIPFFSETCYLGTLPDLNVINNTVLKSKWNTNSLSNNSYKIIAEELAKGKIIGIFRGAAEFGPRALGHRSILADPRSKKMKDLINKEVKGRESYRPFAPIVLEEYQNEWFEDSIDSPFMSFTFQYKTDKVNLVPAVVHEDNTGRVQTINKNRDPWLYSLIKEFNRITGVPIILNTSFNIMGKPIVHSVQDAVAVFGTTGLDGLLMENIYFEK